jgi:hypothetical protein
LEDSPIFDEKVFADLGAATRLRLMPDSMLFTSQRAALFLRISPRTMEELRHSGEGRNVAKRWANQIDHAELEQGGAGMD